MSLALEIDGLTKTFHLGFLGALRPFRKVADALQMKGIAYRVDAVRGISLNVEQGEIFGFLGPNGAGKTTTIKMLMGLIHPSAGGARIFGQSIGHIQTRERIGFLPEHPYFYEHLKPIEFLEYYARLFPMTARERKQRAQALIDRVGLNHAVDRPLRKYSKGMIQRVGLAQALINDPDLVILDEPMSGLDPMGRKDVRDIILELSERGKTIFFSSHILQDVEMLCSRVSILVDGQIRREGQLSSLLSEGQTEVEVTLADIEEADIEHLSPFAKRVQKVGQTYSFATADQGRANALIAAGMAVQGTVVRVVPVARSLESVFVEQAASEAHS
ncbi:MAG: ABC transporter ATP-binding protein [Myxococcota bacterium]|nr:ABC transporter ATP-binding protein [Myxococcota bacterium]